MWLLQWFRDMARWLLGALQLAPAAALVVAILVDEGPSGEARASSHFFPLVLWLFDDFAWTCARNSVIFALVVSVSSLVLGVGLRCALARVWLPGRSACGAAVVAVAAISPAFLALGLKGLFGEPERWPWPFATIDGGSPGASLEAWSGVPLWLMWIWATVPAGAALVALACESSFRRLDPSWDRAARLAGANSFRIARDLSWPIVRPAAARAAGIVFVLAIVEPGAPLVLGLRRTLAFQIVDGAGGSSPFPRTAVWALSAALLGLCGCLIFRWIGGAPILPDLSSSAAAPELDRRRRRSSHSLSFVSALLLAMWMIVAWLPIVGLFRLVSRGGGASHPADGARASGILAVIPQLSDPILVQVLLDSAVFGLQVACGLLLIAWLAGLDSQPVSRATWRRWLQPLAELPPLVLGVGVLAVPWLAALASRLLLDRGHEHAAVLVGNLAAAIDTREHPFVLMAGAVGLALLARFFRNRGASLAAMARNPRLDSCYEATILSGASRWRAWTLGKPGLFPRAMGRFVVISLAAATNLTPALILSIGSDRKPLGPAILDLAAGDAAARSRAAALALAAVLASLAAVAAAHATRAMPSARDLC
jgi:ABC-type Fe3+ transport system permease subunit